jgi:thiamine-phosphate pyrophosphorylase
MNRPLNRKDNLVRGIYPILDAQWLEESGYFKAWTRDAIQSVSQEISAAGVSTLQLRCKKSGQAAYQFLESWVPILRQECTDTALIINDRVDLALYFEADGVHVGQDDLPVALCRKLLGDGRIIGLSTHNPEEIRHAGETTADYLGFGPVFSTTSKADAESVRGIQALKIAVQSSPLPLVAIGGIGLSQLVEVQGTGVSSAAMISGLWDKDGKPQFCTAAQQWKSLATG